jgi:hypothetical protein
MTHQHIAVVHRGEVTVVAIAKGALAAINEFSHPGPVLAELCQEWELSGSASRWIIISRPAPYFP